MGSLGHRWKWDRKSEKLKDLSGQIFSRLTVVELLNSDRHGKAKWLCQCVCGKKVEVIGSNLIKGNSTNCGCVKHAAAKLRGQARLGTGQGSGIKYVFGTYRGRAKSKNWTFNLSFIEFCTLTSQSCHYCGIPPSRITQNPNQPYTEDLYNGVDRKNNELGYFWENCLTCCWACNRAKGTYSYEEFIEWIQRIFKYQNLYKTN